MKTGQGKVLERSVASLVVAWTIVSTPLVFADVPQLQEYIASFGSDAATAVAVPDSPKQQAVVGLDSDRQMRETSLSDEGLTALPADNELRSARAMTAGEQDRLMVQSALVLIDSGEIEEAMASLEHYLDETPRAHQSRQTLATIQLARSDSMGAQATLKDGLALAPNYAGFKRLYARTIMVVDPEAAVALLDELPPLVSQDPEYFELYAVLLQQTGRFEDALGIYRVLLQMDPTSGKLWLGYATALEAVGEAAEALAAHRAANRQGLADPSLDRYNRSRLKALRGAQ